VAFSSQSTPLGALRRTPAEMDGMTTAGGFPEPPHEEKPRLPPPCEEILAAVSDAEDREAQAAAAAAVKFDQANGDDIPELAAIPVREEEARRAQGNYERLADKDAKTDPFCEFEVPNKERKATFGQRTALHFMSGCFVAGLYFLSYTSAVQIVASRLYPSINTIRDALPATGVVVTVLVGGPLALYRLMETDADRRTLAVFVTRLGIRLGVAWLLLVTVVGAIDHYVVISLTAHRFHGNQAWLNQAIPASEAVLRVFLVPCQVIGEAMGCVAIELMKIRVRAKFFKIEIEDNPAAVALKQRIEVAESDVADRAGKVVSLYQRERQLEAGLSVYQAICKTWMRRLEIDNRTDAAKASRDRIAKFMEKWGSKQNA
jgi:hypothetical protein